MQVLCGLQVVFFLFNCQTPGRNPDGFRPFLMPARQNCANFLQYDIKKL